MMSTAMAINFKELTLLTIQDKPNIPFHSGCKMYTWTSGDQPIKNFHSIELQNDYTAFLSIKLKQHAEDEWHVLLRRYRLMESAHGDIGSNRHIILTQKEFIFMPRTIYQIRFVLQQPSPIWKDFSLNNVKIHNQINPMKDCKPSIERLLANTLINDDQMSALTSPLKIPSINELSQHLQGMWSICATMQQMEIGEDHIKRFDIDGSYDLQMLSYT